MHFPSWETSQTRLARYRLTLLPVLAYGVRMKRKVHGPMVRALREALGIKHGEFANRCLISAGYLSNIEKNAKQPSPAVAKKMAEVLGVSLDAISYPAENVREVA